MVFRQLLGARGVGGGITGQGVLNERLFSQAIRASEHITQTDRLRRRRERLATLQVEDVVQSRIASGQAHFLGSRCS